MKTGVFSTALMAVVMACGVALGADPGGRYLGYYDGKYNKDATITIKKSGADGYSVEVMLVQGMFACGFSGKGKLEGDTIRVVNGGYTLPVYTSGRATCWNFFQRKTKACAGSFAERAAPWSSAARSGRNRGLFVPATPGK